MKIVLFFLRSKFKNFVLGCGDETFTIGSGKVDPNCLDAVFGYTCKFGDFIQNKFYAKPFDKFNVNSIRNSFEQWMKYSFKPFDAAQ